MQRYKSKPGQYPDSGMATDRFALRWFFRFRTNCFVTSRHVTSRLAVPDLTDPARKKGETMVLLLQRVIMLSVMPRIS